MSTRPKVVNCGLSEHGFRGMETYELPKLWCLHLYFYQMEIEVLGRSFQILPGTVTLLPPGERIVYQYSGHRYRHFFVHFAVGRANARVRTPFLQHLPQARDEMLDRLQNMQRVLTSNQVHAGILFWGLLWDIAESGLHHAERGEPANPLISIVEQFVESSLPGKLTATDVAEHAGLSMAHVNRVIRSSFKLTTVQFIRRRRLQRAFRLLVHSTMPIKLVAAECGLENLQQFNKLMRAEYGKSPRELRTFHSLKSPERIWAVERE